MEETTKDLQVPAEPDTESSHGVEQPAGIRRDRRLLALFVLFQILHFLMLLAILRESGSYWMTYVEILFRDLPIDLIYCLSVSILYAAGTPIEERVWAVPAAIALHPLAWVIDGMFGLLLVLFPLFILLPYCSRGTDRNPRCMRRLLWVSAAYVPVLAVLLGIALD